MTLTVAVVQVSIAISVFLEALEERVRQFFQVLSHQPQVEVDTTLQELLGSEEQWKLLSRLSSYDREHHLCVWGKLHGGGQSDPDLLRAALLHDVGKADERGRVRLIHRVLRVFGQSIAPDLVSVLTTQHSRFYSHGLYLAEHHAELGARLAREAGVSERSCYLIAMHEQKNVSDDPALQSLITADSQVH